MSTKKKKDGQRVLASNRRARHDYHVLDTFEAGMALAGTEVKAARNGKIQLKDSFVSFRDGEAWLLNAHFSPYSHGNRQNHEPERPRKLLLNRREISKLEQQTQATGLTVVPLEVYLKGPWIKVRIALVQGKKQWDKRETERRRTQEKEAREAIKHQTW
ncbi:MAG: SsrA-binding protein SmpB [Acidobacteriota bacterium]|nr:SsrA-binding protein SmpB [Acidobacteriota bacterium]